MTKFKSSQIKKILIVTITILIINAFSSVKAQKNVIKANIFSPLVRTGSFFYERGLNENSSLQLGVYFTSWKQDGTGWSGVGITPEYRYYPSKNVLNRFYIAPFLRYQSITISDEYEDYNFDSNGNFTTTIEKSSATLTTFGGGFLVGHQWILGEYISIDSFVGPCYNYGELSTKSSDDIIRTYDPRPFAGFGLRFGLTVGIAF